MAGNGGQRAAFSPFHLTDASQLSTRSAIAEQATVHTSVVCFFVQHSKPHRLVRLGIEPMCIAFTGNRALFAAHRLAWMRQS
jgi:hypothetical protein